MDFRAVKLISEKLKKYLKTSKTFLKVWKTFKPYSLRISGNFLKVEETLRQFKLMITSSKLRKLLEGSEKIREMRNLGVSKNTFKQYLTNSKNFREFQEVIQKLMKLPESSGA